MEALPKIEPPVELVRRLARTWEALQPLIARSLAAEGLGQRVRPGMGLVLFALFEEDGRLIGEIAQRGHVSHVAALRLVSRMEQAGLVQRKDCLEDGRATRVWLTASGRSMEARMHAASRRNREVLARILGAQDAATLNDLLGRLLDGLAAENAAAAGARTRLKPARRKSGNSQRKARS
jgi:DNA-binding MarR family transcriptional regulator